MSWWAGGRALAGCCRVCWELNPGIVEEGPCCAPLPSKEGLLRKTSSSLPLPTSSGMERELMEGCSPPSPYRTQTSLAFAGTTADALRSPPDWIPPFSFDLAPPTAPKAASRGGLSGVNTAHLHSLQALNHHPGYLSSWGSEMELMLPTGWAEQLLHTLRD